MSEIFQVPATLVKAESMSHWWRLVFDSQENVTPETMAVVLGWLHKLGWLTFNVHQIEAEDILDLPELKRDDTKTPSQRLRAVLYRLWEQNNEGIDTFTTYYEAKMEKLINAYKEKLT